MLLKVMFAVLLLVVATTAITDDNAIVDLALENYFGIVNATGTCCNWPHA